MLKFSFHLIILCSCFLYPLSSSKAFEKSEAPSYCKPSDPCWPAASDWQSFGSSLTGKLEIPQSPTKECKVDALSLTCVEAMKNLKNPFFLEDQSGGTQSTGWLGAWSAETSAYAVAAENSKDIVAAVNFARKHRLHLVIKSTGHDYLGRSNAPDSLLVWTHKMRKVAVEDSFLPRGCTGKELAVPAVSLEAGTRWLEAYQEVTVKRGRYVQGGGCTSVGAAGGFLQGGGFGSWSKKYGTAAANLLEVDVVTADGKLLTANACQNQDLFWALRGGGGGTFGVVSKVILRTHPLPNYFGWVNGTISAKTDKAFKELIEHFLVFYGESLSNEHWGEQVKIKGDNSLDLSLAFLGMSEKEAEELWKPFRKWVGQRGKELTIKINVSAIPGSKMWDLDFIKQNFASAVKIDQRSGEASDLFWWTGDSGQVSIFWYAYQSRWLPIDFFSETKTRKLADTLFDASRHWTLGLHFNKGQAGASAEAVKLGKETSVNPAVYKAAALIIAGAGGDGFQGIKGHEPNLAEGEDQKTRVSAAMKVVREATPGAGTYVNEADYFETNWQQEFWGANYSKLNAIKKKYDPSGMFTCHHCVGSDD